MKQSDKNYNNNFGLIKHYENKDNKMSETLFKKISNNKQFKNQSMTKMKKVNNINYLYNNNNNNNIHNQIDNSKKEI